MLSFACGFLTGLTRLQPFQTRLNPVKEAQARTKLNRTAKPFKNSVMALFMIHESNYCLTPSTIAIL